MDPSGERARRLAGRNAVVTGASSGIGRAVALALAREGARVLAGARRVDRLEALAEEASGGPGEIVPAELDVTQDASVQRFGERARSDLGHVDILVNNAGIGGGGVVRDLDVATWDRVFATNVRGPFLVTKAMLPLMGRGGGSGGGNEAGGQGTAGRPGLIVNVASVAGKMGMAGSSAYCASKHALRGLSDRLGLEVAEDGIRVVAFYPGYVATAMTARGGASAEDMIRPEALADLLVYLATMDASIILDDVTLYPFKLYAD